MCFKRESDFTECGLQTSLHTNVSWRQTKAVSLGETAFKDPTWACTVPAQLGQTSYWSIRSHCSALSFVALAKCQCWDLGLLILLLNVAALSGEKKAWIDLWTKRCFREWGSCLNLGMSRHVPMATPPRSPRTLWSLRMALDYISGTATLYEVFLWNSLYCLTTSTWAQRLSWREEEEGGGAPSRSKGVWYWWDMAGILKVFPPLQPI